MQQRRFDPDNAFLQTPNSIIAIDLVMTYRGIMTGSPRKPNPSKRPATGYGEESLWAEEWLRVNRAGLTEDRIAKVVEYFGVLMAYHSYLPPAITQCPCARFSYT